MTAQIVPPLTNEAREQTLLRDAIETVIVVDQDDRPLEVAGKLDVHETGQLHRAFSILVLNHQGELLLQRRADGKYHFARRWSNTCCGHPRPGESTATAAGRRLKEEFGIRVPLTECGQLVYRAEDQDSGLIEHEYLHIFHGVYAEVPDPDPSEIGAWRWIGLPVILRALRSRPHWFTPWFHLLIKRLLTEPLVGAIPRL